jgi:riboflavin kinase/FMN adenylyltransferase
MQIIHWNDLLKSSPFSEPSAASIGVFDGVHRGHRALVERVTGSGLRSVAVTFSVSPREFFHGDSFAGNIISLERKLELFEGAGINTTILIDFSYDFSKMAGRAFVEELARCISLRFLVVGADFHCGYRNDTDAAAIKKLLAASGIGTEIVPPVMEGGLPVSSSRIRHALAAGEYESAASLLGRPLAEL